MLPLNPIDRDGSPYSSVSSFACEPLLISPELLVENGLLDKRRLRDLPLTSTTWRSSFARSRRVRGRLLKEAYATVLSRRIRSVTRPFVSFKAREKTWLDEYCLFGALSQHFATRDWTRWPRDIAKRATGSMRSARSDLEERIDYLAFQQFLFDRQWRRLRKLCETRGIGLIGDLPMFVAHDSCDVWAHQRAFLLNANGRPKYVAGAPPDAFSATGQRWGNPVFDWAYHQRTGFAWWIQRLERQLSLFDAVRLDHFIGFSRYWRIPSRAKTARSGRWMPARGRGLFDALLRIRDPLPFIAEDLGSVSQEVWDLRDRYGFPGMKVFQFAPETGAEVHRPHEYPRASIAFTGTHDNDTTLGWYEALRRRARSNAEAKAELQWVQTYLGTKDVTEVVPTAIRMLCASSADTVIFPVQDILNLDGKHRMNKPGTARGNWVWRLKHGHLNQGVVDRLGELTEATDRCSKG